MKIVLRKLLTNEPSIQRALSHGVQWPHLGKLLLSNVCFVKVVVSPEDFYTFTTKITHTNVKLEGFSGQVIIGNNNVNILDLHTQKKEGLRYTGPDSERRYDFALFSSSKPTTMCQISLFSHLDKAGKTWSLFQVFTFITGIMCYEKSLTRIQSDKQTQLYQNYKY